MPPDDATATVDFDFFGAVRVRLIAADARDVEAIARQLGVPPPARGGAVQRARPPRASPPEIRVRFVDRLPYEPSAYLEDRRIGIGGGVLFLRASNGRGPWVHVPLDRLGAEECEFVAPHGSRSIPLLREALALASMRCGLTPVHASAFTYDEAGILVAGWAHSGKTSSLLAFAREGAAFVGDDQVFVGDDGAMSGTWTPLELADWQLRQTPRAWSALGGGRRAAFRGLGALRRLRGVERARPAGTGAAGGLLPRLLGGIERRLRVPLPAERVCARLETGAAPLTHVGFVSIHSGPEVRVERCDPGEMLEKLSLLGRHERLSLARAYLAFRCAAPGRRNEWIESADDTEARLLRQALAGTETFLIRHPRPVAFHRLFEAVRPILVRVGEPDRSHPALVGS